MKNKYLLALIAAGLGLTLTACGGTSAVPLNYSDDDLDIDTPWTEYSVPVTEISFASGQESITLNRGDTHTYDYSIQPQKALKSSLSWSSADESVATVEDGVVTAVDAGSTTITVYNEEASFTPVTLEVTVEVPLEYFIITPSSFDADWNHSYQLDIEYHPEDTTQKGVTWSIDNESLASIDQTGLLTTKGETGRVKVSASSNYINNIASINVDIDDRSVYADQIVFDEYQEKVEIGHSFNFVAHPVSATGEPVTDQRLTYKSTDESVLSVVEDTGAVHAIGLGTGSAKIYAIAHEGTIHEVKSDEIEVTVFEVKVASIQVESITLSNRLGFTNRDITFAYTTDTAGYTEASIPQFKYEVANENIATVNDNGKLFATGLGTTTVTVSELRSGVSASTELVVKYECDDVTLSTNDTELIIGESVELSYVTNPAGVPLEYATFESDDTDVVTVDAQGKVTAVGLGKAKVKITILSKTDEIEFSVVKPFIPFVDDNFYIVGNRDYSSGTSEASESGSWDQAREAFMFTEKVQEAHDNLLYEYRAIVNLKEGDIWKIRGSSYYLEPDGWRDGITHQVGEYKTLDGAFSGDDPDMYVDESRNVVVRKDGRYAIYYAQYTNENYEGWYSVYVGRHELEISNTTPKVQINTTVEIEAHNWYGDLTYNVTEGSDLIVVTRGTGTDDYKFTIAASNTAGTAKIVFKDDIKTVEVTVTISTAPVSYKATLTIDKSVFATWDKPVSELSIYLWDDDGNYPLGAWNDCRGNLESGSVTVTHDRPITHYILFLTQEGKTKQTFDMDCFIDEEYGYYKIMVDDIKWKEDTDGVWKMYNTHIWHDDAPIPPVSYTYDYYVEGIGGVWEMDSDYLLTVDPNNANHYTLSNIALAKDTEIKVYIDTEDHAVTDPWLGVKSDYTSDYATGTAGGNLKVKDNGTYNIDVYIESEYGNHIVISPVNPGPEPTTIKTFYFTNNYSWDSLRAYVWNNETKDKPAEWPGLEMTYVGQNDQNQAIYSINVDTALYDYIIFNSGSVQTKDIPLADFGTNNACYISGGSGTTHEVGFWNYVPQ